MLSVVRVSADHFAVKSVHAGPQMLSFFQGGPGIRGARGDRGEPGPVVRCWFVLPQKAQKKSGSCSHPTLLKRAVISAFKANLCHKSILGLQDYSCRSKYNCLQR